MQTEFYTSGPDALMQKASTDSAVVFLSPLAFQRAKAPVRWLLLENKGRYYRFHDWIYHKECLANAPPMFAVLPGSRVMDWEYHDQVILHYIFAEQDTPDGVAALAFATGYQDCSVCETFRHGYATQLVLVD